MRLGEAVPFWHVLRRRMLHLKQAVRRGVLALVDGRVQEQWPQLRPAQRVGFEAATRALAICSSRSSASRFAGPSLSVDFAAPPSALAKELPPLT